MNGAVIPHLEFVYLPRRQRVGALHREVLSSLWIIRVGKRSWRDPAPFVPNVSLKQCVSRRQALIETASHRIGRIEKIRHAPVIIGTGVIRSKEIFCISLRKVCNEVIGNAVSEEGQPREWVDNRRGNRREIASQQRWIWSCSEKGSSLSFTEAFKRAKEKCFIADNGSASGCAILIAAE